MPATDTINIVKIQPREDVKEPCDYNVIYFNDDKTTVEFVIESLIVVFGYDAVDAHNKTLEIHQYGSSIVATLPFEMAEQKGTEVTLLARNNGFPLVVQIESAE